MHFFKYFVFKLANCSSNNDFKINLHSKKFESIDLKWSVLTVLSAFLIKFVVKSCEMGKNIFVRATQTAYHQRISIGSSKSNNATIFIQKIEEIFFFRLFFFLSLILSLFPIDNKQQRYYDSFAFDFV